MFQIVFFNSITKNVHLQQHWLFSYSYKLDFLEREFYCKEKEVQIWDLVTVPMWWTHRVSLLLQLSLNWLRMTDTSLTFDLIDLVRMEPEFWQKFQFKTETECNSSRELMLQYQFDRATEGNTKYSPYISSSRHKLLMTTTGLNLESLLSIVSKLVSQFKHRLEARILQSNRNRIRLWSVGQPLA